MRPEPYPWRAEAWQPQRVSTAPRDPAVDALLAGLDHPAAAAVARLREVLLTSVEGVSEHVKWKAPSFVVDGQDRVTFRLAPAPVLQLVLHRGVRVRDDIDAFSFDDPTGTVRWAGGDRGVLTFADGADLDARSAQVLELVQRWVRR